MKIKICTPVIGKTLKEFLINLDKVQEISEMVELRVDKIKDFKEADLKIIRAKTKKKTILTCRKKTIFLKALNLNFDYIDVDLETVEKHKISFPVKRKTKIILSFHDFITSPPEWILEQIVKRMEMFNPDVIKIATVVRKDSDNLKLVKLMLNFSFNKRIIIGMGEKGKITRILGPFLGNCLTYASTGYGDSAAGQIDIFKLKEVYKLID